MASIAFVRTNVVHLKQISQSDLASVLELRRQRDAIDSLIQESEDAIRASLESGAAVETGVFQAYLKVTERKSVSWKCVLIRQCGEAYANRVLASTKPDSHTSLVISA